MGHVVGHIFSRLVENVERISTIERLWELVLPAEIKGKTWDVNELAKTADFDSTPPAFTSLRWRETEPKATATKPSGQVGAPHHHPASQTSEIKPNILEFASFAIFRGNAVNMCVPPG